MTVNVAELLTLPEVAVIFAIPAATPLARPPLMTVATGEEEVQVAVLVRFCVVPLV